MNNNPRDSEHRCDAQDQLANAAARGDYARAEELLKSGTDVNGVNRFNRTPVQVMMMGSTRVAGLLLGYGADPNVRDCSTGATPLHDAAGEGFWDTVQILLEFGADPEQRDGQERTPADTARERGHLHIAEYLHNYITTKQQQQQQQQQQHNNN